MKFVSMQELARRLDREYQNVHMAIKRSIGRKLLLRDQHYVLRQTSPKFHMTLDGLRRVPECLRLTLDERSSLDALIKEMETDKLNNGASIALAEMTSRLEALSERTYKLELMLNATRTELCIARAKLGFTALLALALCNADKIADPMAWAEQKVTEAGHGEGLAVRIMPRSAHAGYITSALDRIDKLGEELDKIAKE